MKVVMECSENCLKIGTQVTEEMTAQSVGSGDLPVLATPTLVALMEGACFRLAQRLVSEQQTTVGVFVQTSHEKATMVGKSVNVEARLLEREGRKLSFEVLAFEDEQLIGRAKHDRFVVDRARFMGALTKHK